MSKKSVKQQAVADIKQVLHENMVIKKIYQRCPNTCVVFKATFAGEKYKGFGFSKVRYPDVFDPDVGIDLAVEKGLGHLARYIYEENKPPSGVAALSTLGIVINARMQEFTDSLSKIKPRA